MGTLVNSPLQFLIEESRAYSHVDQIEGLIQHHKDFSPLPVQPLYLAIQNLRPDALAELLPRFSKEQREVFLDLDLWHKDQLNPGDMGRWIMAYDQCPLESTQVEFLLSDHFALYLKGVCHLNTFDTEDPQYPEHDFYFLTPDHLLLIEYGPDFPFAQELKRSIQRIYESLGVEEAYAHLFKVVSGSFTLFEEEQYQQKKERLRDYGMVDYYEALELFTTFPSQKAIDQFLKKRKGKGVTGELDSLSKMQGLPLKISGAYKKGLEKLEAIWSKVTDPKRLDWLRFNCIRLINTSLSAQDALKSGAMGINEVSEHVKCYLSLGTDYALDFGIEEEDLLYDLDFFDLYKIGLGLVSLNHKALKSKLPSLWKESPQFFGDELGQLIENTLATPPKKSDKEKGYNDLLKIIQKNVHLTTEILPAITNLWQQFQSLKEEGLITDHTYLNYDLSSLDFESIWITLFAQRILDQKKNDLFQNRFGLNLDEALSFALLWTEGSKWRVDSDQKVKESMSLLLDSPGPLTGLKDSPELESYVTRVLKSHFDGIDWTDLAPQDFKHVGGVVILAQHH